MQSWRESSIIHKKNNIQPHTASSAAQIFYMCNRNRASIVKRESSFQTKVGQHTTTRREAMIRSFSRAATSVLKTHIDSDYTLSTASSTSLGSGESVNSGSLRIPSPSPPTTSATARRRSRYWSPTPTQRHRERSVDGNRGGGEVGRRSRSKKRSGSNSRRDVGRAPQDMRTGGEEARNRRRRCPPPPPPRRGTANDHRSPRNDTIRRQLSPPRRQSVPNGRSSLPSRSRSRLLYPAPRRISSDEHPPYLRRCSDSFPELKFPPTQRKREKMPANNINEQDNGPPIAEICIIRVHPLPKRRPAVQKSQRLHYK